MADFIDIVFRPFFAEIRIIELAPIFCAEKTAGGLLSIFEFH
jgi:hypothetical protein